MAKELIISANVHEKKVAILEDGVVTEFYVERRDENQGVVGNLYKGRVMKVLPGMQSAFVDIGLERDAFLYVSDFKEFMEEEGEVDFRETGDEARPARAEARPRRDDRRRREAPAAAAAPGGASSAAEAQVRIEDVVEQLAEIADESIIEPPAEDEAAEATAVIAAAGEARVERIDDYGVERVTDEPVGEGLEAPGQVAAVDAAAPGRARRGRDRKPKPEVEPAKAVRGSRRKPAEVVETRAAEPTAAKTAPRGARRGGRRAGTEEPTSSAADKAAAELAAANFQRITDEDLVQEAGEMLKDAMLQEKLIHQVHTAEYRTESVIAEPEPEWRIGSLRSQLEPEAPFERISDEHGAAPGTDEANESRRESPAAMRHISEVIPAETVEKIESASRESGFYPGDEAPTGFVADVSNGEEAGDGDADASVRDRGSRGEFAVRRGGRGRRRPRRDGPPKPPGAPGEEDAAVPGAEPVPEAIAVAEVEVVAEVPKPPAAPRAPKPQEPRPERRPDTFRRDRPAPATISDLLREGQDVLVQIAKEPIAKKGARITSHIALPGRLLVYMPTVNHVGVSRKIPDEAERTRLKRVVSALRERESASGGFIARTACAGHSEQDLHDDLRYLIRTWTEVRKKAERVRPPALVHRDLDLVQRILRDQLSTDFSAIRVDNEVEYARIVEFVNRVQPRLVNRVKLYTGGQPILEKYAVQPEIDKAVRPRVWLKSGGYIVINQTEALVAIDVNTGKFVGKSDRLEDTITRTNLEAAKEIVRQVRLRDLGGIIVIDFIDMEERKNRQRVMTALQQELQSDRSPSKILSINDFGLVAITRKRVKQSLERTLCAPCPYCQGAGLVKSAQTMCFEILEQAKAMSKDGFERTDVMLRVSPGVATAFRSSEVEVLREIEAYFGQPITIESDPNLHQEQFDFAVM